VDRIRRWVDRLVRRSPAPSSPDFEAFGGDPVADAAAVAALPRSGEERAIPMPPADVRYRVVSRPLSELDYLRVGLDVRASIEHALAGVGTSIEAMGAVLDWGCGCARVIRHWAPYFERIEFTGTDIDETMIRWDLDNVAGVRFATNGPLPPLPCDDESFDLVYGASVFTHLDEAMQQQWLAELRRVLRPGGLLLLSTHGTHAFEVTRAELPAESIAHFRDAGYVYIRNIVDGILPAWYQTTFQDRDHVARTFSPHVEVLDHLDHGMTGFQDLVICRRH
jgi:SAM-dependent methyltransferase